MTSRTLRTLTLVLAFLGQAASLQAQDPVIGDKDPPKVVIGDRDEVGFQNQRYLKVKNETDATLTIFFQYRTLVKDAFTWLPATPAEGAEAVSFEIMAGEDVQVKMGEEALSASRVRLWATSEKEKWLTYKTRDLWLVPEKNEEGDHVYPAETQETFRFTFAAKKADTDDPDAAAGSTFPEEDPGKLPPDVLPDPGEVLPEGGVMPVIRDLSVRPVVVLGPNAILSVKNWGHASENLGRRLFIRRTVPGALPADLGPIGPLFHNSVRVFYAVGLTPGDYVAFVGPGDEFPYDGNDVRPFTVGGGAFTDLRVLPVGVAGNKATVHVKNVGSAPYPGGRKLRIVKLGTPAISGELGMIGPLPINGVQSFTALTLAPGNYKAFITPGDAPVYAGNDSWTFNIAAASFADLKVLPVSVIGGKAHISVKNVGSANADPGNDLLVVKLTPGAVPMKQGFVGALGAKDTKPFPPVSLAPGKYKAYVSPGDPPPHHGNDSDEFDVKAAPFVNLVIKAAVNGDDVHVKVKNNGSADSPGRDLMIKKMPGGAPMKKGPIPPVAAGDTKSLPAFTVPPGKYQIFVQPGDNPPHDVGDAFDFTVGGPATFVDLMLKAKVTGGDDIHIKVMNTGTAASPAGRHIKVVKMAPGSPVLDKGLIGLLAPGDSKTFPPFSLPPGKYRAFVAPADDLVHAANDDDTFIVTGPPDLGVEEPKKVGAKVRAKVFNKGNGDYSGVRQWHLERKVGAMWLNVANGAIPPIPESNSIVVEGNFSGAATYRIRITGTDGDNTNHSKTKDL